jgi:hypothetical protein
MLALDRSEFIACMQIDPMAESPRTLAEFFPIGMAMRIVRVVNPREQMLIVAKGVARVRLQVLRAERPEVELEAVAEREDSSIAVHDLRRIARFDPSIEASAGVTQVTASETYGPGMLCDFIAAHGQNSDAYVPVLQALDVAERVRVTRSFFT